MVAAASEEREALMRRQWCDIDFQEGAEANQELVQHLERDFASQLVHTAQRTAKGKGDWFHIKRGDFEPGKVRFHELLGMSTCRHEVYLSACVAGEGGGGRVRPKRMKISGSALVQPLGRARALGL